ncbi:hypothetical protein PR048_005540 [Dryococelus australis]|uniref:Uncharacterized protein n=1 Tax=Dryococelus australis TaxID=614101 RepID=A0ABQ9I9J5_9NEOP|nr:hypothetical protein PR048_005540 [Dryococelus australis]
MSSFLKYDHSCPKTWAEHLERFQFWLDSKGQITDDQKQGLLIEMWDNHTIRDLKDWITPKTLQDRTYIEVLNKNIIRTINPTVCYNKLVNRRQFPSEKAVYMSELRQLASSFAVAPSEVHSPTVSPPKVDLSYLGAHASSLHDGSLFLLSDCALSLHTKPYSVRVQVNNVIMQFEIDSGCSRPLINLDTYIANFANSNHGHVLHQVPNLLVCTSLKLERTALAVAHEILQGLRTVMWCFDKSRFTYKDDQAQYPSNGLAECTVQTVKKLLKFSDPDIYVNVVRTLCAMRTRPSCTGKTPAEAAGRTFRTNLTQLHPALEPSKPASAFSSKFQVGELIYMMKHGMYKSTWLPGVVRGHSGVQAYIKLDDAIAEKIFVLLCINNPVSTLVVVAAQHPADSRPLLLPATKDRGSSTKVSASTPHQDGDSALTCTASSPPESPFRGLPDIHPPQRTPLLSELSRERVHCHQHLKWPPDPTTTQSGRISRLPQRFE